MPLYDYRCPACRAVEAHYRPVNERRTRAPSCGSCGCNEPMNLLISPVAGFGDLPGYQSPVTGKWIEGRKARNEDLKRTGSRPYEGKAQELKEVARQRKYAEQAVDRALDKSVKQALATMSPEKRTALLSGE